ncbi:hypothetical protein DSO57_1025030 [Entomophthora muscae]|uniref:Uncharacterized protein n=1 Tax=Entomophthora muscae TaxID=34485 RepID=A0ACC2UNA3_9FUNG|nr:hypothetical protein DSO57_1025030 [Entomophthora muscae]
MSSEGLNEMAVKVPPLNRTLKKLELALSYLRSEGPRLRYDEPAVVFFTRLVSYLKGPDPPMDLDLIGGEGTYTLGKGLPNLFYFSGKELWNETVRIKNHRRKNNLSLDLDLITSGRFILLS